MIHTNTYITDESEVTQSCPTLCGPMDYSLPGSSIHGIFQARVLEWGEASNSGEGKPAVSECLLANIALLISLLVHAKLLQSCLTLCDPCGL